MIVVRFMGGLGNQMFQYATGLRLAMRHNTVLKYDLGFLHDRTVPNITFRDFDLVVFNPAEEKATDAEVRKFRRLGDVGSRNIFERVEDKIISRRYVVEKNGAFEPEVLDLPDNTYLEGFFQNERYFSDVQAEIRKRFKLQPKESELSPGTRKLAEKIRSNESICLHVRRGDYVTNPAANGWHGLCSLDYYKRGMEELRSRGKRGPFFVFSDDVKWCRDNFSESDNLTVVGDEHAGPRSSIHFWLMSACAHFVTANSSFSWWAAWLGENPGKIVIRPTFWFKAPALKDVDICPPSWIKLSN